MSDKTSNEERMAFQKNSTSESLDLSEMLKSIMKEVELIRKRQLRYRDEMHRHIDALYRDIMIVLDRKLHFVQDHGLRLKTDWPLASESLDHLFPTGTRLDNTRYPRFIKKLRQLLGEMRG